VAGAAPRSPMRMGSNWPLPAAPAAVPGTGGFEEYPAPRLDVIGRTPLAGAAWSPWRAMALGGGMKPPAGTPPTPRPPMPYAAVPGARSGAPMPPSGGIPMPPPGGPPISVGLGVVAAKPE